MQQVLRYGVVGVLNTAIGYGLILAGLHAGLGDYAANALGFAAGICFSFVANRRFTFGLQGEIRPTEISRFLACFSLAYALNLAAIAFGRNLGLAGHPAAHLAGMALYSLSFFVLMRSVAFTAAPLPPVRSVWAHAKPIVPELCLVSLAALSFTIIQGFGPNHDVAWQFWISRQMVAGAKLYSDIWEVNPPLWFWFGMPIQALAAAWHVSPFRINAAILVLLGLFAALILGRLHPWRSEARRASVMLATFAIAVVLPVFDFGQREQFSAIGAIAYAALIARRQAGGAVAIPVALAIGVVAAYGFALKHYFALVPMALEAWFFVTARRSWRPVRPETVTLAVSAGLYAAAIFAFAPDFFRVIVPMVRETYYGYEEPVWRWFDEVSQVVWITAILCFVRFRRFPEARRSSLVEAFLICAGCFAAAYFAQAKGWQYHAHPVTGMLLVALAIQLLEWPGFRLRTHPIAILPFTIAAAFAVLQGGYSNGFRLYNEHLVTLARPGEYVATLSSDPMWNWPTAEENGLRWGLSYYSLWMMPAIAEAEAGNALTPQLAAVADQVRARTLRDLRCNQPQVIMIERTSHYPHQPDGYDMTAFFQRDPAMRVLLQERYRETWPTWNMRVFLRKDDALPRPAGCMAYADPAWPVSRYDAYGRLAGVAPPPAGK